MKKDLKKYIPVALILLGAIIVYAKINDFISGVGAIMFVVGIVLLVKANKKKPKAVVYKGAYIANPDSKVFHYPDCQALAKIDPIKNHVLRVPREKLIKDGYKPCKKCDP